MMMGVFSGCFRATRAAAVCCVLSWALAGSGLAQVAVYHSVHDDGFDDGPASVRGHTVIHAYFKYNGAATAPNPAEECSAGTASSDEVCQWAVRLKTTGNLRIVDVAWGGGTVEDDTPSTPADERDGTGGVAVLGQFGAAKIATIAVIGTEGDLRLYTPDFPAAPGEFGFVDKEGDIQKVDVGGVLLAAAPVMGWRALSSANGQACGALANGEIQCWGAVSGIPSDIVAREVAVGDDYGCALDFSDGISCWGGIVPAIPTVDKEYLRLAAGPVDICALTPSLDIECYGSSGLVPPVGSYQGVSRGDGFACGLLLDGRVNCFGTGFGTPGIDFYLDFAGGTGHVCALKADNLVECWGDGTGYSGLPASTEYAGLTASTDYTCGIRSDNNLVECWGSIPPAGIPTEPFASISAAPGYVCGIQTNGIAQCWGVLPSAEDAPQLPVSQVAAGENHTCKLGTDRALECWGSGLAATGEPAGDHVQVASGGDFGCAIDASTRFISCWGENGQGQATSPVSETFTQVVTGKQFACALEPDANPQCWGSDSHSQVANTPTSTSFLELAAGFYHVCGLRTDGGIQCWGRDDLNQASPPGASDFVAVSAGSFHTCGLHSDGNAECWGDDLLGPGQATALSGGFDQIDANSVHSCGLRDNETIACWGGDGQGQASPPSLAFANVVAGGTETNPGFSCGVGSAGSLICWGDNAMGQSAPPLDTDGDGYEDPVDNCPANANSNLLGSCDDDISVSCTDNTPCAGSCVFGQGDVDGDGFGDVCDNCLIEPNPDQFDRDRDGDGDACDPADPFTVSVDLIPSIGSFASSFSSGFAIEDCENSSTDNVLLIRLSCPDAIGETTQIVSRIQLGLRIPGLDFTTRSNYHFGSITGGTECSETGCAGATDLGACDGSNTVDDASGNTFVLKPTEFGWSGDPDVLYMSLEGLPLGMGEPRSLCHGEPEEVLARIGLPGLPPLEAGMTTDGAEDVAADTNFMKFTKVGLQDPAEESLPGADWAFATGKQSAKVRIMLSRGVGDETGETWLIKLATIGEEVTELTFGIQPENGALAQDYELIGCGPPVEDQMSQCVENPPDGVLFPSIDAANIRTSTGWGDGVNANTPNVFWIRLHGKLPSADPLKTGVNDVILPVLEAETDERRVSIGVLRVPPGAADPNTPPTLVQDPIEADFVSSPNTPIVTTSVTGEHQLDDRLLTQQALNNADSDVDGISEDTDNCRYATNGLGDVSPQSDVGGLAPSDKPDGRGDVCQCGDGDGTGQLTGADLMELRHVVARNGFAGDAAARARCSVSSAATGTETAQSCNIKDLMDLEHALATGSFPSGNGNVCLRATVENLNLGP